MAGAAPPSTAAAGPPLLEGWRARFWRWWLHSVFQQSWPRLAIQVRGSPDTAATLSSSHCHQCVHVALSSLPAAGLQVGVCTLLIMCIFSAPPVWELHQYDPILANPVLILVLANLGLLFSVGAGSAVGGQPVWRG